MKDDYDFLVIGGGSAGYNAALAAVAAGARTAVVDGAKDLGGLCILRGCMPSKTLLYSAEMLHQAQHGRVFGLKIPKATANARAIHARKNRIIGDFASHRVKQLKAGGFDLLRAYAEFVDPHTVRLSDGRVVRAKNFLIATGSRVSVPDVAGLPECRYWTSDEVLELDFVPRSVLVMGGGIVACELAQYLNRIGSRVTLIQRSQQLLKDHSERAAAVVRKAFEDEGIEVFTGTMIERIKQDKKGTRIQFRHGRRVIQRQADHLFNALGREPDVGRLNMMAAGVVPGPKGRILVDRWQRSRARHIYAAGDCCGPHEIVHVAIQQGVLAAKHACGVKGLKPVDESLLLSVVFTDPQLATIGPRPRDLETRGVKHLSASYPFNDHGKSILMEANYGFVEVTAEPKRGRILGAEIVGKDAGELIHCFSGPLAMHATVFDLLRAPWYHPTLAEIITYPLEELEQRIASK